MRFGFVSVVTIAIAGDYFFSMISTVKNAEHKILSTSIISKILYCYRMFYIY